MKIRIYSNTPQVLAKFDAFIGASENLAPAMVDISALLVSEAEDAFQQERNPSTGEPWPELSETTIKRRQKKGYWPGKKLQQTGRLAASITPAHGRDFAEAGTNVEYAATMFFGAKKGEFGATSKGTPIPWGDIPGREFLGLSARGLDDSIDILGRHLFESLR